MELIVIFNILIILINVITMWKLDRTRKRMVRLIKNLSSEREEKSD